MMTLMLLKTSGELSKIEGVVRVASRGQFLYYETVNDSRGRGTDILFDEISCWEVRDSKNVFKNL